MPFFFFLNVFNYYLNHKGNICSRQPARQQTEPRGWSAHQPGQWVYNCDGVMAYSYCSRTSLLSSSFLKISCTKQIGYGSIVTSIYSTCSLSRPQALGCSVSLILSPRVGFKALTSATPTCARGGDELPELSKRHHFCFLHYSHRKTPALGRLHVQLQEHNSGHCSCQKRNVTRARQWHWVSQHSAVSWLPSAPMAFLAGPPTLPPHVWE